jgi:hypothetical protein
MSQGQKRFVSNTRTSSDLLVAPLPPPRYHGLLDFSFRTGALRLVAAARRRQHGEATRPTSRVGYWDCFCARTRRHCKPDGNISQFEFHYAIARPEGIHTFMEPPVMDLWRVEEYGASMQSTGLAVEHDPVGLTGRGLFIGVAPTN